MRSMIIGLGLAILLLAPASVARTESRTYVYAGGVTQCLSPAVAEVSPLVAGAACFPLDPADTRIVVTVTDNVREALAFINLRSIYGQTSPDYYFCGVIALDFPAGSLNQVKVGFMAPSLPQHLLDTGAGCPVGATAGTITAEIT